MASRLTPRPKAFRSTRGRCRPPSCASPCLLRESYLRRGVPPPGRSITSRSRQRAARMHRGSALPAAVQRRRAQERRFNSHRVLGHAVRKVLGRVFLSLLFKFTFCKLRGESGGFNSSDSSTKRSRPVPLPNIFHLIPYGPHMSLTKVSKQCF